MAESFVQVATDGAGKQIDTFTSGSGSTHRQVVCIGDSVTTGGVLTISGGAATIQGVQDTSTTGAIIAATTVVGPLSVVQRNVITVSVHGTYAGVTFIIEASDDTGTTWYPLQCINNATGQVGSTWTPGTNVSASYDSAVGGYNQLRVRATAWGSGSASISMTGQSFAYDPVVGAVSQGLAANASVPVGNPVLTAFWDGTNTRLPLLNTTGHLNVIFPSAQAISGTVTVGTITAGANVIGQVSINQTTDGTTNRVTHGPSTLATGALTNVNVNASGALTALKASVGNLYGFSIQNNTAAVAYLSFWNVASGSVTLGTTAPTCVFAIPASAALTVPPGVIGLMNGAAAMSFACVTAYNGAVTASVTGSIFFK